MARSRLRDKASPSFVEALEARRLFSHSVFATRLLEYSTQESSVFGTQLTSVETAKLTAAGLPLRTATIDFEIDGTVVGEAQTGRSGYAAVTLNELFVGKFSLQAVFAGAERYVKSSSGALSPTVTAPTGFTTLSDGTEYATVTAGTGSTTLTSGGAFTANYAGYLASNGEVFDSSLNDVANGNGGALSTSDDSDHLIVGFAEGIEGMKVGETRVLLIPSAEAYGPEGQGSIPANANLVFIVHLDSIG